MHEVMNLEVQGLLKDKFHEIKDIFESVPEYKTFYDKLQHSFESNIDGFEHKLEIDLQAYDPNNYFNALKIIAKDGDDMRSFDEFGTGEQQILLMAFVKAYAETFKGENFILGIEEPEAHLHPLAQKWLFKNINKITHSGVQVIITTHSPEFLDIENIEGFVKIYKEENITKSLQHSAKSLSDSCITLKAHPTKTTDLSILPFYKSKTFYDQLRGFFARKIILVEGETEFFALPNYFSNCNYDLIKNGVEIVNCHGKNQITRNYRLFHSYGYECFCLFDSDSTGGDNDDFATTFDFEVGSMINNHDTFIFNQTNKYGYFGKDFESYMRNKITDYSQKESEINGEKVLKAKIISENNSFTPDFIESIALSLNLIKTETEPEPEPELEPESIYDDIPF
jgi:putative ATP-dependent endonuclease of OLD family